MSATANDVLEVLHLWMAGWRPMGSQWVWGWDQTHTRPLTDIHQAVLDKNLETAS